MQSPEALFIAEHETAEPDLSEAELALLGGRFVGERLHQPDLRAALRSPNVEIAGDRTMLRKELDADIRRVADVRDQAQRAKTERSQILEAALVEQIERADWLGPDVRTMPTSEFDDWFNHTDLVAVIGSEGQPPRYLAIDVTTAEHPDRLNGKVKSLTHDLDTGRLTSLKWVVDEEAGDDRGPRVTRLAGIPRVVIGTDADGVRELSTLLLRRQRREPGSGRELGDHHLQLALLREIRAQLENAMLYSLQRFFESVEERAPTASHLGDAKTETAALARAVLDAISAAPDERAPSFDRVLAQLDQTSVLHTLQDRFRIAYPIEHVLTAHRQVYDYLRPVHDEKKNSVREDPAGASATEETLSDRWAALGPSERVESLAA